MKTFLLKAALCCSLSLSAAAQVKVINEGFPGENTAELQPHMDEALRQFHPNIVILFAGTNDALNDRKLLPTAATATNLQHMVREISAAGAKPVLVQLHDPDMARLMLRHKPEAYGTMQPLERLALVNKEIGRIARKEHAALVPFNSLMRSEGGATQRLSTDGVHLTAEGYGLLAQAIRAQLPKQLPADTTIVCFGDSLTYGIGVRPPGNAPETPETYPAQLRKLLR